MKIKKLLPAFILILIAAAVLVFVFRRETENFSEKYEGADLTADHLGLERKGTYTGYLDMHKETVFPQKTADIDLFTFTGSKEASVVENYEGADKALFTDTGSLVTWEVDVPETGFYNLYLEYLIPESRGVPAERAVYINGEVPFEDARNITFSRIFTDGGPVKVDNQGNQIRPAQVEVYGWQSACFRDDMGYVAEPYTFWLEKGKNTLSLEAVNEPMVLKRLALMGVQKQRPYKEYLAEQSGKEEEDGAASYLVKVQGEESTLRSESSL